MSIQWASSSFCEHNLCLYPARPGGKYCRKHELTAPETINKAHKLLQVEAARARDTAARARIFEQGLSNIYAVRAADAVKFGRAINLKQRLETLQIGCPITLQLIESVLGPSCIESCIHYFLKPKAHLRGEWFRADHPKVIEVIELMRGKNIDALLALNDF